MNKIPTEQNAPERLELLAAQRQLYSDAKRMFFVHAILAGPLATAAAILAILEPLARPWSFAWGTLLALLDVVWLTPRQERLRELAATVQERFDCEVLQLPWNEIKVPVRPGAELIARYARQYAKRASRMPPLANWYAVSVGALPLALARLICQRSSCWWDSEQRRRYAWLVLAVVAVVVGALTAAGIAADLTVTQLLMAVVAPLVPMVLIALRQVRDHRRAADRLDGLRVHCEQAWSVAKDRGWHRKAAETARRLQDEIFECRRTNPPVFDIVFRRLRPELESQMSVGVDALVAEAQAREARDRNASASDGA